METAKESITSTIGGEVDKYDLENLQEIDDPVAEKAITQQRAATPIC